jgi:ubiquitin-conjugating enzyme E2 variant
MPPRHLEIPRAQSALSALGILLAVLAVLGLGIRLATRNDLVQWWVPLAGLAGVAAADLASGLVHWAADTWGRHDLPVVGRRLLVPFRVHHVNPDDFLTRRFVDANGDVAWVTLPVLAALLALPLDARGAAPLAVFGIGLCGVGMWTNQIHQWAHRPSPPAAVRMLQDAGLILGRRAHARHHAGAFDQHYCITTGWWNRPLDAIGFFRRLERAIARATGAVPREDELNLPAAEEQ